MKWAAKGKGVEVVGGRWDGRNNVGCKMFMGKADYIEFTGLRVGTTLSCPFLLSPTPSQASHGYLVVGVGEKRVMVIGIGFNFGVETTYSMLFAYFPRAS